MSVLNKKSSVYIGLFIFLILAILSSNAHARVPPGEDGCGDGRCYAYDGEDVCTCPDDCGAGCSPRPTSGGTIRVKMDVPSNELWEFYLGGGSGCSISVTEEDFGPDDDCLTSANRDGIVLDQNWGSLSDVGADCPGSPDSNGDNPQDVLWRNWGSMVDKCGGSCDLSGSGSSYRPKGDVLCDGNWYLCDNDFHQGNDRPFEVNGNQYICTTSNDWDFANNICSNKATRNDFGCCSPLVDSNGYCCESDEQWDPSTSSCISLNPVCNPGETRITTNPCGTKCGVWQEKCNSQGDAWVNDICVNEGACSFSNGDYQTQSCTLGTGTETKTCTSSCQWPGAWDTSGCTSAANCGNNVIDSGEECDDGVNNGNCPRTCSSTCQDNNCATCGNNIIDSGEECDDGINNGNCPRTCSSTCNDNNCATCGNNIIDSGEQCDGSNLNGQSCQSLGYSSGSLSCSSCTFTGCSGTPPPPDPKGAHDGASCGSTDGWTCDSDNYGQPLDVHFYVDGPAGSGTWGGSTTANLQREPAVGTECGGNQNHGFLYAMPAQFRDANTHTIYAYAINIGGGNNVLLAGSPKSFGPCPVCTPNTWSNTGNSCGNCGTEQRWCGSNGQWTDQYQCINQGPCSPNSNQCVGTIYQWCNPSCQWQSAGTDNDGDGVYWECGDSQCDNAYGVSDATKTSTETRCADSLDNDCDGIKDCQDPDCAGLPGPGGVRCCLTSSNCVQDDCAIESCVSNTCQYSNRLAGDTTECGTCQACDSAGGNCAGITSNDGKNCGDQCTSCISGSCTNRVNGDTAECGTCQECNGAGGSCVGITRETGKNCISDCNDCVSGSCNAVTKANDGACSSLCTYCSSGSCTGIQACYSAECPDGQFCNSAGSCGDPDSDSFVCLTCTPDQTAGFSWTNGNHQDAGKGYGSSLFDSNTEACPATSCAKPGNNCQCYDASGNSINHKAKLLTNNCCGDDANEYYKSDYYGAECVNDINDCVWSTGEAQASNTGNAQWWCYTHEWYECLDSTIGAKVGGVTCAGIIGNNKWTPNSQVLPENQYSCTDGKDNDGDSLTDCADPDCAGLPGPGGVRCCQSASNCVQDDCVAESCVSNNCQYTNRNACDSTECSSGYCYNGDCTDSDNSEYVCLNCVADTTPQDWQWSNSKPTRSHMIDAGKAYSTNNDVFTRLFDSAGNACSASSCNASNAHRGKGCACYSSTSSTTPVNRLQPLTTGNCCGDDTNEYFKRDYYGGECVNNPNVCVWGDGSAQPANSGNAEWWCNPGDWYECNNANIGNHDPPAGMCCAGIIDDNAWTPMPEVLGEDQYSCADNKDNDCDGAIDCEDTDCYGTLNGTVRSQENNNPIPSADISVKEDLTTVKTTQTNLRGDYSTDISCGTYNLVASHYDYASQIKANIPLSAKQTITEDFSLVLGTSCEQDCTYASDNIVHAACDGKNGCSFYDAQSKAVCDLSQPGWIRDYDADHYVVCASGSPKKKVEIGASVTCSKGTLVKVTRIVTYNGKPVKMIVAACG